MDTPTIESLVQLAASLDAEERAELIRRIESLPMPQQRPSATLRVFHVDQMAPEMTLRREDEYGDDDR